MSLTNDDRLRIYRLIISVLYNTSCRKDVITDIATLIEGGCLRAAAKQCLEDGQMAQIVSRYSLAISRACSAIDPRSSACADDNFVITQMQIGDINPEYLGTTQAVVLNPSRNQETMQKIQRSLQSKIAKKVSKTKVCKFCSAKQVSWYEVQTRSLDEPKTIFNNCEACAMSWVG